MDSEHGGPKPIPVSAADRRSFDLFPGAGGTSNSASTTTVLVAFLMNVLVAVAKSVAAAARTPVLLLQNILNDKR